MNLKNPDSMRICSIFCYDKKRAKLSKTRARRIRALSRPDAGTVPIIAMTADAFAGDIERCGEAGMNGHIAKPVNPQKLNAVLKNHILGIGKPVF